jgi:hypothetical protein
MDQASVRIFLIFAGIAVLIRVGIAVKPALFQNFA